MLTQKFKTTVGIAAGLIIAGGLTANQYTLQQKLEKLENKPAMVEQVMVSPSAVPTASPSATLAPVRKLIVTVVPRVTK